MTEPDNFPRQYPAAMVNITNKCTLRCRHCFVFREGNPISPKNEMDTETMLAKLAALQKKHGINTMLWMGNERALELTLSENCQAVTANCPSRQFVLPLYLDGQDFVAPFCCYGNDVDRDLCGAWVVFYIAGLLEKSGAACYRSDAGQPC